MYSVLVPARKFMVNFLQTGKLLSNNNRKIRLETADVIDLEGSRECEHTVDGLSQSHGDAGVDAGDESVASASGRCEGANERGYCCHAVLDSEINR